MALGRGRPQLLNLRNSLDAAAVDRGEDVPPILIDRVWNPWGRIKPLEITGPAAPVASDIGGDVRRPWILRLGHAIQRERQRHLAFVLQREGNRANRLAFASEPIAIDEAG